MKSIVRSQAVIAAAGIALASLTAHSPANARGREPGPVIGYVTYEDIQAPVRLGARGGREVLVPNWGWTDCHYSCAGALESHTGYNFWDMQTNNSGVKSNILNNLLGLR